ATASRTERIERKLGSPTARLKHGKRDPCGADARYLDLAAYPSHTTTPSEFTPLRERGRKQGEHRAFLGIARPAAALDESSSPAVPFRPFVPPRSVSRFAGSGACPSRFPTQGFDTVRMPSFLMFFLVLTLVLGLVNAYLYRWAVRAFSLSARARRGLTLLLALTLLGMIFGRVAARALPEAPLRGLIVVASTVQLSV